MELLTPAETARFQSHVNRGDACWEWTGAIDSSGRGRFHLDGQPFAATHLAFYLKHGRLPKSRTLRQTCDNKLCVRADHLLESEPKEPGVAGTARKLDDAAHERINALWDRAVAVGRTYGFLSRTGREYGVSPHTIKAALPGPIRLSRRSATKLLDRKLIEEEENESCRICTP